MLLIVEVSDSSLAYDRRSKAELYAEFGIGDYWIVNLKETVIEVYSEPLKGRYQRITIAKVGEALALPGDLGAMIDVSEVF